jgi:hypothetical protein
MRMLAWSLMREEQSMEPERGAEHPNFEFFEVFFTFLLCEQQSICITSNTSKFRKQLADRQTHSRFFLIWEFDMFPCAYVRPPYKSER